jgi:hypothetical protein
MHPYYGSRSGFRIRFIPLLLCVFGTGCYSESFRGESGNGHMIGVAVAPAVVLAAILLPILGYFLWRRSSKH